MREDDLTYREPTGIRECVEILEELIEYLDDNPKNTEYYKMIYPNVSAELRELKKNTPDWKVIEGCGWQLVVARTQDRNETVPHTFVLLHNAVQHFLRVNYVYPE